MDRWVRTLEVEMHIYKENVLMEMQGLASSMAAITRRSAFLATMATATHKYPNTTELHAAISGPTEKVSG